MKDLIKEKLEKIHKSWRTREVIKNQDWVDFLEKEYPNLPLKEQLFLLTNDMLERPKCVVSNCNNSVSFYDIAYKETCSYECSNALRKINGVLENSLKKYKQTCLENLGVDNASKSEKVKNKRRQTNIERHGNPAGAINSPENRKRSSERMSKLETQDIMRQRLYENHGVENASQLPDHYEKCVKTMLRNFNVDHYTKSEEFKQRSEIRRIQNVINLCTEKITFLGTDNPSIEKILTYDNPNYLISFKCECGNQEQIPHETFKYRIRRFSTPCSCCAQIGKAGSSSAEKEILSYIKNLLPEETILENNRTIIKPQELDIVIPNKKIAIEYNGLFYHSDFIVSDSHYHQDKLLRANEAGYRLITIFEDEWIHKQEIVKKRLRYILRLEQERIFARKCTVKEITLKDAKNFIEKYHIQGYGNSSIKIGLFYKKELVSVMTFSKPNRAKGRRKYNKDEWELSRFCSSINAIGAAGKIFSFFQKKYNPKIVYTYADLRWNTGEVYEKMGFIFVSVTPINYWYIDGDKRIHRFKLRKTSKDNKIKTEKEIRKEEGWKRIYDCGNLKYVWKSK